MSPLATVMRKTLEDGSMPADWRTTNVCPIFKKGAKKHPGNYRSVSLTAVCCKMLESIIKDDIVKHLEKHKLIRSTQHGFMKRNSCTSNLLAFLEKITVAVDNGDAVDIVFLDFAKAFDKVRVERLLKKVWAHGIQETETRSAMCESCKDGTDGIGTTCESLPLQGQVRLCPAL